MKLRLAEASDAAALAAVHAEGFDPPWSVQEISDVLTWPGVFGLLAGDAADDGMILVRVVADDAEVLTLAVAHHARRKGVARALLAESARLAVLAGADAMFLEVAVDNDPAIALYAAAGFASAGRRKDYYDRGAQGTVDALALRLDLNSVSA